MSFPLKLTGPLSTVHSKKQFGHEGTKIVGQYVIQIDANLIKCG